MANKTYTVEYDIWDGEDWKSNSFDWKDKNLFVGMIEYDANVKLTEWIDKHPNYKKGHIEIDPILGKLIHALVEKDGNIEYWVTVIEENDDEE